MEQRAFMPAGPEGEAQGCAEQSPWGRIQIQGLARSEVPRYLPGSDLAQIPSLNFFQANPSLRIFADKLLWTHRRF